MKHTLITLLAVIVSLLAHEGAGSDIFKPIKHPIRTVYAPEGYDADDTVQIVIEGTFKNTCFQMGNAYATLTAEEKIEVSLEAYEYVGGDCSDYPSPFHKPVLVGLLGKSGNFPIVDKTSGRALGNLHVEESKGSITGTDSRRYASLLDAYLEETKEKTTLHLDGVFTLSCLEITNVTVLPQSERNAVVVLPTIEKNPAKECVPGEFAFTHDHVVKETLPAQRYLLHVRAMGGQAINKIMIKPPSIR